MSKTEIVAEPGKYELTVTRVFDAPRDLVFKVSTDPESIPHWWGPSRLITTVAEMEVRPGGRWRFVQRDPEGNEHAFRGVYHSITPNERIIQTFEYEGVPGHVLLETLTFEEYEGKTRLIDQAVFQSVEDRDAMVGSGMEEGALEMMDRLAALLEKAKVAN